MIYKLNLVLLLSFLFLLVACGSDPAVKLVKNSPTRNCAYPTLGDAAKNFMVSPKWSSLVTNDGKTYVNLQGEVSMDGVPTTAVIQFAVNEDDGTYEYNAMEINGEGQNALIAALMIARMCGETRESLGL